MGGAHFIIRKAGCINVRPKSYHDSVNTILFKTILMTLLMCVVIQ